MPLQKLQFRPGLNREGTDYSNEGGWYDGDKIRFRSGYPEKIGGWTRMTSDQYIGVARSMWNWINLGGTNYLGVGTSKKYYIESGGYYNDITPIVQKDTNVLPTPSGFSALGANPISTAFSTLNGGITDTATSLTLTSGTSFPSSGVILIGTEKISYSNKSSNSLTGLVRGYDGTTAASHANGANVGCYTVTITDSSYAAKSVGDYVLVSTSAAVGGITVAPAYSNSTDYIIKSVSGNTFTILCSTASTSAATGGGDVYLQYELPSGLDVFVPGDGWGAGPWATYTTSTLTNPFTATNTGITVLTVTQTSHGLSTGDFVYFYSIASNPCGISKTILQQAFQITKIDANTYTIDFSGISVYPANPTTTSTGASGGTVIVYMPAVPVRGWGDGYPTNLLGQQLRLWSNDNYGQDLVIAPRGGAIYYWQNATGVNYRAQSLASLAPLQPIPKDGLYVPKLTNQVLASAIQRFVISLGANSYSPGDPNTPFDPMLVRWSDQEDPYQWVPEVTNQSGEFRLTNGSYIVGGRATRQEILVWTDSALYSMQYLGPPYVWGFQVLMDNISVMSPNSMITVQNVTYWMGTDKFYMYSGRVETLPCALRQYIFNDINKYQSFQVFAGSNEGYNEIWWFYCSTGSNSVDKYVIYNYLDRVWYYGSMARTAWLDSGIRQYPMAADYNNRILYHESSVDDEAGQSAIPISAYVQSSDFDIGDGHNFGFVWRILPDVNFNGSNVNNPYVTMTIKPRRNSGTAYGVADNPTITSADNYKPPNPPAYTIQEFTGQVYTRLRGRQMSFRIASDGLGVAWQLGSPRIDIRNDGRR